MKVSLANMDVNLLGTEVKVGDVFPNFKAVDSELRRFRILLIAKRQKTSFICSFNLTLELVTLKQLSLWITSKIKEYDVVVVSYDTPFGSKPLMRCKRK
nr:hypothetical protein [Mycoplasmopsis bovis]